MKQTTLKRYLDEVCDMLDAYGGRDKVISILHFELAVDYKRKTKIFVFKEKLSLLKPFKFNLLSCKVYLHMIWHSASNVFPHTFTFANRNLYTLEYSMFKLQTGH